MLFFSNILGAEVRDSADELVGKLKDVAVKTGEQAEFAAVAGIEVKVPGEKENHFISANSIEDWSGKEIYLLGKKDESVASLPVNGHLVFLKKSVLDKQIVDLEGLRVVRVNDLQLGKVQGALRLLTIDISFRAILRRIGFGERKILSFLKPHLVQWRDVNILGDKLQFVTQAEDLKKLHPADIANIIEKLNVQQGSIVLQSLDKEIAAKVLEEVEPDIQKLLIESLGADRAASVMSKMSIDELVDLIQLLPSHASHDVMNKLPPDARTQKIKKILEYDEDTAGGLMTTEYLSTHPDATAEETVAIIKKHSESFRSIQFVYVLDKEGKFVGVVSLRRLIIADRKQLVKHIMKKERRVPAVKVNQSVTEVAALMTKYNLFSAAVLEKDKRMLGVVTVDDVMRHFMPHA